MTKAKKKKQRRQQFSEDIRDASTHHSSDDRFTAETLDGFTFTDKLGREWDVSLDMAGAHRIDNSDFSALSDEEFTFVNPDKRTFMLLLSDSSLLFAMVWAVVQPQVKRNLDIDLEDDTVDLATLTKRKEQAEIEFLSGLNGRAIREGREAFWRAIADFFPEHQTVLLALMRQFDLTHRKLAEKMGLIEEKLHVKLDHEMDKGLTNLMKELEVKEEPEQ